MNPRNQTAPRRRAIIASVLLLTLALFQTILVAGCSITDTQNRITRRMQSYVGKPSARVFRDYGEPYQKVSDGEGGEIWFYRFAGKIDPDPVHRSFRIRPDGTVYDFSWAGM